MDRFKDVSTASSRRTIATYASYAEAQKAVDYLSDNKFEVEKTAHLSPKPPDKLRLNVFSDTLSSRRL